MGKKTIAVVTGTRAEYGLLRRVIKRIVKSDELELKLIVTGSHLKKQFGETVCEIEKDGFDITARFDILQFENSEKGVAKSTAFAIQLFSEWFFENKPDACLVLGDRYEIFAAATSAALANVPVIHISGGDVTLGAKDEWFRHSITKMAALHFPSCQEYADRVIRMGEEPQRVFNVGGLGDENIRSLKLLDTMQLSNLLDFNFNAPFCLVTFHPETQAKQTCEQQFIALLSVLEQYSDIGFVFTKANADAGGEQINKMIDKYVAEHKNCTAYTSMGVLRYLSAMKYAKAVIGNSSSGVVETPTFGVPTVNIGDRQKGRIICDNVICCTTDVQSIKTAIDKAFSDKFNVAAHKTKSPYNGGATSKKIVDKITQFLQSPLSQTVKSFYDAK